MEIRPDGQNWRSVYKIMIGSILPRPIGWISTNSPQGQPNLAPFSFFSPICANPAHVLFCPTVRSTDNGAKDSFLNLRATGEFVANIVTEGLADAMNVTSTEFPTEINEFERANLTAVNSKVVAAPRVAESPVSFECKVAEIIEFGRDPGGGNVVIGEVVYIHVSEDVLYQGDKIDLDALRPIGRLAGTAYCRVTDVFDLHRPPSQIRKG